MTVNELRDALRLHRLEQGLSFEDLATAINADRISAPTVRRFIESETTPHETTVHLVRTYLERVASKPRQRTA